MPVDSRLTEDLLAELEARGLLPPAQVAAIRHNERTRPFSLHQELRAMLYLGVTLLAGGLGVLLYQHFTDIGFLTILLGIIGLMLGSFGYAWWQRQPFTWGQATSVSFVPDYALLLACLLFLALETYLQATFNVFGTRYGLATVLPAVLFLALAYRFDHRGVLAMGLTALASWVGVNAAPVSAFTDFHFSRLGGAAVLLGLALVAAGLYSDLENRKRHFAFTYVSLGANVGLLAATAVLLEFYPQSWLPKYVAVLLILALSAVLVWYARRTRSYLFLLMGAVYGYVAITYLFIEMIDFNDSEAGSLLVSLYFMLSGVGVILLFTRSKEFLRR